MRAGSARPIRLGLLLDGERLPAEPQLAEQFGIATVTLREALAVLRDQGLVVTRRGRGGGSFVRVAASDPGDALPRRLRELSTQDIRELGDQRTAVSGTAARLAAERALPEEIESLRLQAARLSSARHGQRAAACRHPVHHRGRRRRPVLAADPEELRLRAEVGDLLWLERSEADHAESVRSRVRLVEAIARRDTRRARELAEEHVAADTERLLRLRLAVPPSPASTASVRHPRRRTGTAPRGAAARRRGHVRGDLHRARAAGRRVPRARRVSAATPSSATTWPSCGPHIFGLLADQSALVAGAGLITVPGTLSDTRYWLEWWWTRASGIPEALRVNLDPAAPDFFDYTDRRVVHDAGADVDPRTCRGRTSTTPARTSTRASSNSSCSM